MMKYRKGGDQFDPSLLPKKNSAGKPRREKHKSGANSGAFPRLPAEWKAKRFIPERKHPAFIWTMMWDFSCRLSQLFGIFEQQEDGTLCSHIVAVCSHKNCSREMRK